MFIQKIPSLGAGVGWKWSLGAGWGLMCVRMVRAVFLGGHKWLLDPHWSAAKLLVVLPGWGWDGYNILPWEKIWETFPMAPVTALECRCPTQTLPLMLSTSRRLHPLFCSVGFWIIAQLWIVSDFSRERDVYFRICWGATSSWLFQEWKPKIKPLCFYFSFENQCVLNVLWIIFKQLKKNKCVWQMSHLSINLSTGQSSKQ